MAQRSTPLTAEELEEFREALLQRRRELTADIEQLREDTEEEDEPRATSVMSSAPTHPADVGTHEYEAEKARGLLQSQLERLAEIDRALDRIEKGTYGICEASGEPIQKRRLQAKPWARYTIEVERRMEARGNIQP